MQNGNGNTSHRHHRCVAIVSEQALKVESVFPAESCVDLSRVTGPLPSLTNNLHEHTLPSSPIKLAIENLFPWAEVQFAFRDGNNHFAAHDLAFHVSIGVVFTCSIVVIKIYRLMRRQFLQPNFVVMQKAGFIVVYEYCRRDVHGVDEAKALLHATLFDELGDGRSNVEVTAAVGDFEPEMFG
jgi:hypothetical protein